MYENYLKDLEEMSERGADFAEYYHKLLDGVKDLNDNQREMFVWVLMDKIRDIGYQNGKRATKEAMINFLNCS